MNVDMITTFLNDFSTFWKNIWEFLKPIFNIVQGKDNFGPVGKENDLKNLNELAKAFGKDPKVGEGYTPADKPAGSSENK
ncbi:hypothetical protein I6H52_02965 [Corynebacterium urealyticum]|uniref:Uncharacterized protein n=1 Tax=Corynebacterium urealyticum (strain ATCC 43042 / DSM 7109) TaxID=504474 RepID=B1VHM4_CORU7|nr:hypothetical protein [Corynebacterium urealyticum]AGE37238.1 putative porin [Corynebacterium urealyticum DSM 7111]QQB07095.1 hypothetical protein I6H53_07155 [Corynebacterium urealyticum]QQC42745.1 hypothetical protein I6H51_04080 [Corynebacterium urealyticum]QQE51359.1 hypothetical protein I6H52_02965 [Corynebacterium urealyticum]CAQ05674.1 hypothetical protein cu1715 [Corynebacterium urealyticum DSM 7109]